MRHNPILDADSYKLSHAKMYPPEVEGLYSYIEPRSVGDEIVFFGLNAWLEAKRMMLYPNDFPGKDSAMGLNGHGLPFDHDAWPVGDLPLKIWAVPEGTVLPSGLPLVAVECTDPRYFWLASYIETSLQRAIWYPTTIASQGRAAKKLLMKYAKMTGTDPVFVDFQLHDFGARGVSSAESTAIGGLAHLVNFKGTDNMLALQAAHDFYDEEMAGFSVPASEHSVQCAWGPDRQPQYLEHVIRTFGKPGGIVSLVLDGYDLDREIDTLCSLAPLVKEIGCKVVFRPDSGDARRNVLRCLNKAGDAFGYARTSTGHMMLNNAAVLQGDGVDMESMREILNSTQLAGFASGNVVFGSGGALLQKINRDTYRFAMKASAIKVGDDWLPIYKDPATDPSKKSKGGRVAPILTEHGYEVGRIDDPRSVFQLVYDNGKYADPDNLSVIRERCKVE